MGTPRGSYLEVPKACCHMSHVRFLQSVAMIYSLTRAVMLLLGGLELVQMDSSLEMHLVASIPSFFFLMLQTTLIIRWHYHVSQMTIVLDDRACHAGYIFSRTTVIVGLLGVVLIALGFRDHFWGSFLVWVDA